MLDENLIMAIVNGSVIVTKTSILDVLGFLDLPLRNGSTFFRLGIIILHWLLIQNTFIG